MAIYRLSAQMMSRGSGRSATAAAAYRSGSRIADEHTNRVFDYARRNGVVHTEILAPPATPAWMLEREALWNAVERVEKRKDAQLCREVQLALPHELGLDGQVELVREFVGQQFVSLGMIADIAIHDADRQGDRRNIHVHVMLTLREVTRDGFGNKERGWNDKTLLARWREQWAGHVNHALARAGHAERVDHRTLAAQRLDAERQAYEARAANDNQRAQALEIDAVVLDREPQPKIGHAATALERQGRRTERGDHWRAVVGQNFARLSGWMRLQRLRIAKVWAKVETAYGQNRTDQSQKSDAPGSGGDNLLKAINEPDESRRQSFSRAAKHGLGGQKRSTQGVRKLGPRPKSRGPR